jgi:ABC-type proline/glycine betaine transport system substrate-binding protein
MYSTKCVGLVQRWLVQNQDLVSEWSDMYSTKHVGLVQRWLAQNQDIVSEWSDMYSTKNVGLVQSRHHHYHLIEM